MLDCRCRGARTAGWWQPATGVRFIAGTDRLAPDAPPALARLGTLVQLLASRPIRIVARAEASSGDVTGAQLAQQRAAAIEWFLVGYFDVDPSRLLAPGHAPPAGTPWLELDIDG